MLLSFTGKIIECTIVVCVFVDKYIVFSVFIFGELPLGLVALFCLHSLTSPTSPLRVHRVKVCSSRYRSLNPYVPSQFYFDYPCSFIELICKMNIHSLPVSAPNREKFVLLR